jgi:radical SAM protein with 4Fe4S-binding SPASM domain
MSSAFNRVEHFMGKASGKRFKISTVSVIRPENIEEIEAMVAFGREKQVDHMFFLNEMYCSEEECKNSAILSGLNENELMHLISDGKIPYSYDDFQSVVERIFTAGKKEGVFTYIAPMMAVDYPREFYYSTLRVSGLELTCDDYQKLYIDYEGNVILCPHLRKSFGNLTEQDLRDVWNSPELRGLRMSLLEQNLLPLCRRCCMVNYAR